MPTIRRRQKGAAKAPPSSPAEKERRIELIEDRIVSSTWVPRITPRELAAEWKVDVSTVMDYYLEARRTLKRAKTREHSHVFEMRLEAMIAGAMSQQDFKTAGALLKQLREWRTEHEIVQGRAGAAGTSIADLEAARIAAKNNERKD